MDIINRIIDAAKSRGITAYALSRDSHGRLSPTHAHRLMRGDVEDVRLSTLVVVCEVLGFDLELTEREVKA